MPWVQRVIYALRTLMEEDEVATRKKKTKRTPRRQATALVLTINDLFTSGHLNLILENIEQREHRLPGKSCKLDISQVAIGLPAAASSPKIIRNEGSTISLNTKIQKPKELPLLLNDSVLLLHEEKIISCPRIDFQTIDRLVSQKLAVTEGTDQAREKLSVSLPLDDEKKTVAVLRKVLKWSPRKQSAVSFKVPLPKKEEYKAVAVVQNVVNRVKEENLTKKKKWKFPKLKLC